MTGKKKLLVLNEQEAGWTQEMVWTILEKSKIFCSWQELNPSLSIPLLSVN
jgi:predicted oxidoreductase (fatty acid repression mutant protein)